MQSLYRCAETPLDSLFARLHLNHPSATGRLLSRGIVIDGSNTRSAGRPGARQRPELDDRRARRRLRRHRHLAALCGAPVPGRFRRFERARHSRCAVADRLVAGAGRHGQIRPRHHAGGQSRRGRAAGADRAGLAHDATRTAAISVDHGGRPCRRRAVLWRWGDHPGDLGAQRGRGSESGDPTFRALRHSDFAGPLGWPLPGAAARHGGGGRPVRPGDAGLVRHPGTARPMGDRAAAACPSRPQPALRV